MTLFNISTLSPCSYGQQHDAQLDYYGKRLATCSSDRTVKVFDVVDGAARTSGGHTLKGYAAVVIPHMILSIRSSRRHTGPVWQVAWAHPKFGHILASCSYDGKALIWKEQAAQGSAAGGWTKVKEHTLHTASGTPLLSSCPTSSYDLVSKLCVVGASRAWGYPRLRVFGRQTLCSDFQKFVPLFISTTTRPYRIAPDDGQWGADIFNGHAIGCNAVSWAPAILPGSLITPQQMQNIPGQPITQNQIPSVKRFASAGCDNLVKIWAYREDSQSWVEEETLEGHTDWVRDVAWAPNIGLPRSYIATASQDKTVLIWTKDTPTSPWVKTPLDPSSANVSPSAAPSSAGKFPDVVWRVSWSLAGNLLAVSCGDGKVTLWKENLRGVWECVSDMNS